MISRCVYAYRVVACAGAAALAVSCAAVRQVRPLEPGESLVTLSAGGPLTKYVGDTFLPLPLLSVGYGRGLTSDLGAEAGIDLTHALFRNVKFDVGVNWWVRHTEQWQPAVTVSPRLHFVSDFRTAVRIYPEFSLRWTWKARFLYPYVGTGNFFELQGWRADGQRQRYHWFFSPYAGLMWQRRMWQYQIEACLYTPNLDNDYGRAPQNLGLGRRGIFGIFLAIGRSWPGVRREGDGR